MTKAELETKIVTLELEKSVLELHLKLTKEGIGGFVPICTKPHLDNHTCWYFTPETTFPQYTQSPTITYANPPFHHTMKTGWELTDSGL